MRNLYVNVGAIAEAIEANLRTVRESYKSFLLKPRTETFTNSSQQEAPTEHLYWFISLRGHIFGNVLDYYLAHLQHAQEKLIQMLENRPGSLPGPTLLRRWSSGGLGAFLSEYSRQVNKQVQQLVVGHTTKAAKNDFDAWREDQYFVHTWSHFPTSQTTKNVVNYHDSKQVGRAVSLTTVWSSYFYLELPVLFPLLYHECAHHYASPQAVPTRKASAEDGGKAPWFKAIDEAATILLKVAPFEGGSTGFWREFVNELWADALSIALGRQGYLVALLLQIFGLQTKSYQPTFSDYDISEDTKIPLDEIGKLDRRIVFVDYPLADLGYLWPARALFALEVYRYLLESDPDFKSSEEDDLILAFRELIDAWLSSGAYAKSSRAASHEHETFWNYRESLNRWVLGVMTSCFSEFISDLKWTDSTQAHVLQPDDYELDPGLVAWINKDINQYARTFLASNDSDPFHLPEQNSCNLGDICPSVRWWISGMVARDLTNELKRQQADRKTAINRWLETYVDYISCDGSVPFRMAIEWISIKRDLVLSAAKLLSNTADAHAVLHSKAISESELALANRLWEAISLDSKMDHSSEVSREDRSKKANELAHSAFTRRPTGWPTLSAVIDTIFSDFLDAIRPFHDDYDNVGTFTLGVVRPAYATRTGTYAAAVRDADLYFQRITDRRKQAIRDGSFGNQADGRVFVPLIGEYSFAVYQPGLASTNKAFHPAHQPPLLLKPRGVLRIARGHLTSCAVGVVRVAQLDFKYRWQWLLLAKELSGSADIYLSSGWEDVILVTRHDTLHGLKQDYSRWSLRTRRWLDIHSNIGLTSLPVNNRGVDLCTFDTNAPEYVARWSSYGVGQVSERTGRFDVTIQWSATDPIGVWDQLNRIPAEEWRAVISIVTSTALASNEAGTSDEIRHDRFISELMMRR